jgi:hypothetical protein
MYFNEWLCIMRAKTVEVPWRITIPDAGDRNIELPGSGAGRLEWSG